MTSTDGEELRGEAEPASSERRWRWPGVASTPMSATGPAHYAILEAGFAGGLAGVIALTRRRDREGQPPIGWRELPILALATFTLADVVAKEKVSTWLREPFVAEGADHKPCRCRGQRHAPHDR